jgi:hypothetical protein
VPIPSRWASSLSRTLPSPVRLGGSGRPTIDSPTPAAQHLQREAELADLLGSAGVLSRTCDELAMKEHARQVAADLRRIRETYWFGPDVAGLSDVDLPSSWA